MCSVTAGCSDHGCTGISVIRKLILEGLDRFTKDALLRFLIVCRTAMLSQVVELSMEYPDSVLLEIMHLVNNEKSALLLWNICQKRTAITGDVLRKLIPVWIERRFFLLLQSVFSDYTIRLDWHTNILRKILQRVQLTARDLEDYKLEPTRSPLRGAAQFMQSELGTLADPILAARYAIPFPWGALEDEPTLIEALDEALQYGSYGVVMSIAPRLPAQISAQQTRRLIMDGSLNAFVYLYHKSKLSKISTPMHSFVGMFESDIDFIDTACSRIARELYTSLVQN